MSERPPESLKETAMAAAGKILGGADPETPGLSEDLRRLREFGLKNQPLVFQAVPRPWPRKARLGVWELETQGGRSDWVRSEAYWHDWTLWADVERIPAKSGGKRVVLLGESVARGFFLDPYLTAAKALEGILNSGHGPEIEVLDLARTDLSLSQLRQILPQSLALGPQAIVVFAGNNWRPPSSLWTEEDDGRVREFFKEGAGARKLKVFLEERHEEAVAELLKEAAVLAKKSGVPILFVIPEFNLLDWPSERGRHAPFLAGEGENEAWARAYQEAGRALAGGDGPRAQGLARRMHELDGGTSPAPPAILARVCLSAGDREGARQWLEKERDAESWFFASVQTPRPYGASQRALRRAAELEGLYVVDLPKRFKSLLSGGLPDRRLFYDYCHLTAEGMKAAMAAVAEILGPMAGKSLLKADLESLEPDCPPKVLGEASLAAAIHCAQWGAKGELVRFHLEGALRADPSLVSILESLLECFTHETPVSMSRALEEIAGSERLALARYLQRLRATGESLGRLSGRFLEPALDLLKGRGSLKTVDRFLREAQKPESKEANLLRTAPVWEGTSKLFYTAYEPESEFFFLAAEALALRLNLTYRSPHGEGGKILVSVGGEEVGRLEPSRNWRQESLQVPRGTIRPGVNRVVMRWPAPASSVKEFKRAKRVFPGPMKSSLPWFGEIHAFTASWQGAFLPQEALTRTE